MFRAAPNPIPNFGATSSGCPKVPTLIMCQCNCIWWWLCINVSNPTVDRHRCLSPILTTHFRFAGAVHKQFPEVTEASTKGYVRRCLKSVADSNRTSKPNGNPSTSIGHKRPIASISDDDEASDWLIYILCACMQILILCLLFRVIHNTILGHYVEVTIYE